jgi:hypothetical protein
MVRSRGNAVEIQEVPNTSEEIAQEDDNVSTSSLEEQEVPEKTKKQWDFSEKRKASLEKARAKAKELREQLKIANPSKPKEKKPTKLEKKIEELKETPKAATPHTPADVQTTQVLPKVLPQVLPQVLPKPERTAGIIRQGKFMYLVD